MRIWFPSRWIIKRIQNGETEVIPTIIVDAPAAAPMRSRPEANEVSDVISTVNRFVYFYFCGPRRYSFICKAVTSKKS